MRRVAALVVASLVTGLAAPAAAQPAPSAPTVAARADQHAAAAAERFRVGDFEGALAELRAAHAIDPRPGFLWAMATIEEQRGGCAAAIAHYEQFLATAPPDEDAE